MPAPGGGLLQGGCLLQGGALWRPPGTATAAGLTHPTGMHSCLLFAGGRHDNVRMFQLHIT